MNREAFIALTVDWLNQRVAPAGVMVDADTRLFERGIVDSLGILKLIAWTERALGRRIEDREVRMDRFGSVRDIARHFVLEGGAALPALRPACAGCARAARCGRRVA